MTNHLEWHQHAFIDENNVVLNTAVFDEWAHNHQLLEDVRIANKATQVICCCTFGLAGPGDTWDGTKFIPRKPYDSWVYNPEVNEWRPPIPEPEDYLARWDEASISWVPVV